MCNFHQVEVVSRCSVPAEVSSNSLRLNTIIAVDTKTEADFNVC